MTEPCCSSRTTGSSWPGCPTACSSWGPTAPPFTAGGTPNMSPGAATKRRACGRFRNAKEVPMRAAIRIASIVLVQLLLLTAARPAAADAKEAMEKLKALSQGASASYTDGDFDKTRSQLQEAIAVAKENGLSSNRLMAQVYILFGVLKINEHKDTQAGVRYFAKALDISPAAKVPPTMATKAVKAAFAKAEDVDPATIGDLSEADPPPSGKKSKKQAEAEADVPPAGKKQSKKQAEAEAAAAAEQERQEKAEAAAAAAAEKKQAAEERKRADADRKQAAEDRKRSDAESKQLVDDLAQTKVSESQIKSERDKLKSQLGEAKNY